MLFSEEEQITQQVFEDEADYQQMLENNTRT